MPELKWKHLPLVWALWVFAFVTINSLMNWGLPTVRFVAQFAILIFPAALMTAAAGPYDREDRSLGFKDQFRAFFKRWIRYSFIFFSQPAQKLWDGEPLTIRMILGCSVLALVFTALFSLLSAWAIYRRGEDPFKPEYEVSRVSKI
jgi:hypothetical protein